jgi:hypothetical protein
MGAAGMVALTVILLWLLTDDGFRVRASDVTFSGLQHADEATVRAHLAGLDRSPNAFRVRASEIVSELGELPQVRSAEASVVLPSSVSVQVEEREPIFVWSDGQGAWLVDREGMLFAPAPSEAGDDPTAGASQATAGASDLRLPRVEDGRFLAQPPTLGAHLPTADLAVMGQLLAISPELLGSRASELRLRVDQHDGYVLDSDRGWQAVFGHYMPTLQPPETVPLQVSCLRWLLGAEERQLERVYLAVSEAGCGTFSRVERRG